MKPLRTPKLRAVVTFPKRFVEQDDEPPREPKPLKLDLLCKGTNPDLRDYFAGVLGGGEKE